MKTTCEIHGGDLEDGEECLLCWAAMEASRHKAMLEYEEHLARRRREQEQEECPHDEHDHGICLDCGKDIMDELIGRAELLEDR
jgi:hypothetical protein